DAWVRGARHGQTVSDGPARASTVAIGCFARRSKPASVAPMRARGYCRRARSTRGARALSLVMAAFALGLFGCEAKLDLGSTCAFNSECQEPLACRNGRCRVECLTARDCPRGTVCLAAEGSTAACQLPEIDVCEDTTDCKGVLSCQGGFCTTTCESDADCLAGARCSPTAGCVECIENADCGEGQYCDPARFTCVFECTSDDECGDLSCVRGRCSTPTDAAVPMDASSDAGTDAGPPDSGRPPC